MLFSIERANNINRKFIWIGQRLSRIFFSVKYSLERANLRISAERYLTASFFSAAVYGLIFFSLFYGLFFARDGLITSETSIIAGIVGLGFSIIFFMLHIAYPSIMAKNYSSGIENSLLFGLNSMLIQVSSGVSLFSAMSMFQNQSMEIFQKNLILL